MRIVCVTMMVLGASTAGSIASSSDWYETEGARVRIVTTGAPNPQGELPGMIDIDLSSGWKTYWRDPGGSGVPPSIDIAGSTNVSSVSLNFPVPMRFNDESGPWNGYKHSVAFPARFKIIANGQPTKIEANIFLGICETICVPVKATLTLDPASDPDNGADAMAIEAAHDLIPAKAEPDFGVSVAEANTDSLEAVAVFPGNPASADLFVDGTDGYTLGTPEKSIRDGKAVFLIPILDRPADKPGGDGLPYTLSTRAGAVDGYLPYP